MRKVSILLHYTHKQTLGHTTRVLSIASALVQQYGAGIKLNILQGGLPQPFIRFPKAARIINIPAPFDSRASFKGLSSPSVIAARSRFVMEAARRMIPDVFVTEFFPFGRIEYADELLPTLKYLRNIGVRIYASIGYPHVANIMSKGQERSLQLILQMISLYDRLLIHTPPGLENPYFLRTFSTESLREQYTQFFQAIAHKITYTGYILPPRVAPLKKHARLIKHKPGHFTILVSRGGGAVYPKIIANAIQAQSILGEKYHFVISSGPSTTQAERTLFHSLLKKCGSQNTTLLDYLPDLPLLLKHAQVSVSMCGYNTSTQLLYARAPSVVIPYVNDFANISSNEQLARSLLLRDHIQSTILNYPDLNARTLAQAIKTQCPANNPREVPQEWFSGNKATARYIMQGK